MASIEQNKQWWNEGENVWGQAGDQWSSQFGEPTMQWYASILPRIHPFVPSATILEIAPGFGRWTQFLANLCENLILVDLSVKCIEACQQRFRPMKHIHYHVNDGRCLDMVPNNSLDFAFSFDSLVHVEMDVIDGYLAQLAAKLTANGVGFIHHSNLGAFAGYFSLLDRLPRGRGFLSRLRLVEPGDHKRARSVTADLFASSAASAGLKVVSQELINWETYRPIDCISIFTKPQSIWDRDCRRLVNREFSREASYISRLSKLYDKSSFHKTEFNPK